MGAQFALLTEFNLKNYAIVYIRLLFDNFKLASFKLISVMKKKIKKVQKPLFATLALFFYFFNFLQVYAS